MPSDEEINVKLAILRGDLNFLREAINSGKIKVPQDLIKLDNMGNSALHLAARYGQIEILRFLLTGLDFGLDPKIKNEEGHTAIYIAKRYGGYLGALSTKTKQKREAMSVMLEVAAMPVGSGRDQALRTFQEIGLSKHLLPKQTKRDFSVPHGNADRYDEKRFSSDPQDSAALYNQIRNQILDARKALNAELSKQGEKHEIFFTKARSGTLTRDDVQEFILQGGNIKDTAKGGSSGNKNVLHLLIQSGSFDAVKLVIEGVEVSRGKKVSLPIDDKACNILNECLQKFPNNKQFQQMAQYFQEALTGPDISHSAVGASTGAAPGTSPAPSKGAIKQLSQVVFNKDSDNSKTATR